MARALAVAVAVGVMLATAISAASATGIASTISIAFDSTTVCGILAGPAYLGSIQCARPQAGAGASFPIVPNVSFSSMSGGRTSLCGLRADGASFLCWDETFRPKRVYNGPALKELTVGDAQIAAVDAAGMTIQWWRRKGRFPAKSVTGSYRSLTSGRGFTCAVNGNGSVHCWGPIGGAIEAGFVGFNMSSLFAGDFDACGIDTGGRLICGAGRLIPPSTASGFRSLALGSNHTCAIRRTNGTVVCWGGPSGGEYMPANTTEFEFIIAGGNLTCGLTTVNFNVLCWWADGKNPAATELRLPSILPGVCVATKSSCRCGVFPDSAVLCPRSGIICYRCDDEIEQSSPPTPSPSQPSPTSSERSSKGWLAFAIVGSFGTFAGICSLVYCIWFGVCRREKVHNSVQPTITPARNGGTDTEHRSSAAARSNVPSSFTSAPGSRSQNGRRQSSLKIRAIRRQRSGPSSFKEPAEEFSFSDLAAATKNFALDTKIGAGSFGTVYRGILADGREVAIKRSESGPRAKKYQEKESAFRSEQAFLSRLHHKHLVGLVGYCEEETERLLVYDYMKNGALFDHLHPKNGEESTALNSWKMRIKVLLDAARGIEYLHNYAVPPIIHRDVKSSNILLDGNWVARVSDFGLSLLGPEDGAHLSMKAAGTVGYMDPEYYGMQQLTVKSDVYGLGVVMLEVLTGKRAIFEDDDGNLTSVVNYAVPLILANDVGQLLDPRVARPGVREAEAVEIVAYIAVKCVRDEGRDRPSMTDIASNLECALSLLEESHGSMSSASVSIASAD